MMYFCRYVEICGSVRPAKPFMRSDPGWSVLSMYRKIYSHANSVVVDSHIQRIVLATEETTVTQQVSHRPIKCQSRLWSQRGTKVNGSHHGDNPLLRPTGIQIATKSYAALQAMAPTNIKTDQYREQPQSTRNVVAYPRPAFSAKNRKNYAPTSFDQQVQVSQGHTFCTEIRKIEIPRSMVVEALNW